MSKNKEAVKKWQEFVTGSDGYAFFLPESFQKEAENLEEIRRKFNEDLAEVAKREIELQVTANNLWLKVRAHIEKTTGNMGIWKRDIGWNKDALEEGLFVINTNDPQ